MEKCGFAKSYHWICTAVCGCIWYGTHFCVTVYNIQNQADKKELSSFLSYRNGDDREDCCAESKAYMVTNSDDEWETFCVFVKM